MNCRGLECGYSRGLHSRLPGIPRSLRSPILHTYVHISGGDIFRLRPGRRRYGNRQVYIGESRKSLQRNNLEKKKNNPAPSSSSFPEMSSDRRKVRSEKRCRLSIKRLSIVGRRGNLRPGASFFILRFLYAMMSMEDTWFPFALDLIIPIFQIRWRAGSRGPRNPERGSYNR